MSAGPSRARIGPIALGRVALGRLALGRLAPGRLALDRVALGCLVLGRVVLGCFAPGRVALGRLALGRVALSAAVLMVVSAAWGQGFNDAQLMTALELAEADERAAKASFDRGKYAEAREQAEKIIAERASFIATFVLGDVHAEAEGNLARGLFLMRKARGMLEQAHGRPPETDAARSWHRRMILRESAVLGQMDRREEQLAAYDLHDRYYVPPVDVFRIWPLLKLARFDEARTIGAALLHDERPVIRERAYNGLMAVEEEAGNRKPSYEWGLKGMVDTRNESCIIATNTALGARRAFQFAETITHDQVALKAKERSCPTSPHAQLTAMFLVFGQYQQSLSALQALRKVPRPPDMRVQNEMVIRARFVELLLALGQIDEAATRVEQILAAPDRAGMISAAQEIVELSNNLLGFSVLTARAEQLAERASARSFVDAVSVRLSMAELAATRWRVQREATRLAAVPKVLHKHVRPYYTDVMPWYGADMLAVFGAGVMRKAIAEARAIETDYPSEAGAFLDAYLAELAWREGALDTAIPQARAVLAALPAEPKLLRHRLRAVLADAVWRSGRGDAARADFAAVLDFAPSMLRQLGIAVPASVDGLVGPRAAAIADRLADSPRLDLGPGALFQLMVEDREDAITVCLKATKRMCASIEGDDVAKAEDPIAAVIDAFHDTIFAPRIELTQSDINSLDGRAVRQDARQALDSLLGPRKAGEDRR